MHDLLFNVVDFAGDLCVASFVLVTNCKASNKLNWSSQHIDAARFASVSRRRSKVLYDRNSSYVHRDTKRINGTGGHNKHSNYQVTYGRKLLLCGYQQLWLRPTNLLCLW